MEIYPYMLLVLRRFLAVSVIRVQIVDEMPYFYLPEISRTVLDPDKRGLANGWRSVFRGVAIFRPVTLHRNVGKSSIIKTIAVLVGVLSRF